MILILQGSYVRTQAKFPNYITQEQRVFQNENFQLFQSSLSHMYIYLSPCQVASGVIPQAVGQVEGDLSRFKGGWGGGWHAQTNTLPGIILPPPGWADLARKLGNGCLGWREPQKKEKFDWICRITVRWDFLACPCKCMWERRCAGVNTNISMCCHSEIFAFTAISFNPTSFTARVTQAPVCYSHHPPVPAPPCLAFPKSSLFIAFTERLWYAAT